MPNAAKRTLIIGPSWVGDMVMAQSLFIDLIQQDQYQEIDVLAPAWTGALIDRMPEVKNLISANFDHGKLGLKERFRLGKQLRDQNYNQAIVLPNSLKSALVPAIAKIPIRSGFLGEQRWGLLNDIHKLDKSVLPMTVQRFIALGLPVGSSPRPIETIPVPKLNVSAVTIESALEAHHLNRDKRVLVLCPGAEFGASKKWPPSHYAAVARHYLELDFQVWLMGSQKDVNDCNLINRLAHQKCEILAGATSLPEAIDLISCGDLVVSNDSGLMHIAAALQVPLIAIYGSTDPSHTPPLSANHMIARLNLDCSPCFKRECPLEHLDCLTKLSAKSVITQATSLLEGSATT